MFGNRYFAPRYFADRYYPPVAIVVPPEPEQPAVAGGVRFFAPRAVRGWARVVAPAAECRITAQVVAPAILSAECRAPAALLDVPLGTVKSRIHAARTAVRPLLRIEG